MADVPEFSAPELQANADLYELWIAFEKKDGTGPKCCSTR